MFIFEDFLYFMKFWYVNAFANEPFKGNPAAVFLVSEFPSARVMQKIAREINLSETTFVKYVSENHYHIRWFSPKDEAPLCGHATIAATHILNQENKLTSNTVQYTSIAGDLAVDIDGPHYTLDLPSFAVKPCPLNDVLRKSLKDVSIDSVYEDDILYMVVLSSPDDVQNLQPDLSKIATLPKRAVIVTAAHFGDYDFVSRYFAPKVGIFEDPVCGSAHCRLTPFWAKILKKNEMTAFQMSKRTGVLNVKNSTTHHGDGDGDRVLIQGKAYTSATCDLHIPLQTELFSNAA